MSDQKDCDPSDSSVQLDIEHAMLDIICERYPNWRCEEWKKISTELGLPIVWKNAKPDAVWQTDDGVIIIAECYAHVGDLNPGHRRKLAMDAFKLLSMRNAVKGTKRMRCLLIVPEELYPHLQAKGWLPEAIRQAAEVMAVKLTDVQHQKLKVVVNHQGSGQARLRKVGEK
jgi:hypothetical protein